MNSQLERRRAGWDSWIQTEAQRMAKALPVSIPDADLERAKAHLSLAFSNLPPDSEIYKCRADTVLTCLAMSAMTGLMPGGHNPDVYLIPRKKALNWQISYRGYVRLARRTKGWDVQPLPIFNVDTFSFGRDSERGAYYEFSSAFSMTGKPDVDWKELKGVFLVVTSPAGEKFDFLTKGQIQQRRNKAATDRIWEEWPIEKAMATACRWGGQREMWPTDDPSRYAMEWEAAQASGLEAKPRRSLLPDHPMARVEPEVAAIVAPPKSPLEKDLPPEESTESDEFEAFKAQEEQPTGQQEITS